MLSPSSALPPPSLLLSLLANYSGSNERPPFPVENDLDRIFGRRLPRLMPPPPPPQRSRERGSRGTCAAVFFSPSSSAAAIMPPMQKKKAKCRNILTRLPHYFLPLFPPIPRDEMRRNRYPYSNVWPGKGYIYASRTEEPR